MIPYFEVPAIPIGSYMVLQPFTILVVIGCLAGIATARWHALSRGLNLHRFYGLVVSTLIAGFVVSHLFYLIFYHPERIRFGLELLNVGSGMSSFGGFLGGTLGAVVYLRVHRLAAWEYIDALLLGLAVGWFFGRLGCTIIHDHPGTPSNFFLAVEYPGGPRHDLGFYEWLFSIGLNVLLFALRRTRPVAGVLTGIACVIYAPARFLLDFLRISDPRYLWLTPG
jgi:phosphatidylglycerol:prolipoprotein diacylglycerol transferase